MSFSNGPGGTIALPSPTHGHKLDVPSAVRNLRRSFSRSPSKVSLRSSYNNSETSPQSPSRRYHTTPQQLPLPGFSHSAPPATDFAEESPFTPSKPSIRLSLRSSKASRTASPSRPLARPRPSPKSPLRRILNSAPDSGNVAQHHHFTFLPNSPSMGQENHKGSPNSPASRPSLDKPSRHSLHIDISGTSQNAFLKALDAKAESPVLSTTGALKRSDATMNLDQPNQGSPVAKRRSLHGISGLVTDSGEDFNIFGAQSINHQGFDIHEDSTGTEYELTTSANDATAWRDPLPSPIPSSHLPKRSSSLRKSTLQQRYGDKAGSGFGRRIGERQLVHMGSAVDLATPVKNRPRVSTDQFFPPPVPRDGISTPGPSTTTHAVDGKTSHQPHPLSKTLTTSSSGNSLTEETYQYAPAPPPAPPRIHQAHPFSRSLPVNATRPTGRPLFDHTKGVAATPAQDHQPWQGFHSTGLLSKVNRNMDDDDKGVAPPDTPCKKQSHNFATFPPPLGSAMKKKKKSNNRNSFGGTPSTPFAPSISLGPDAFGNQGKGLHIFQRASASRSARRGSFLFQDADDAKLFDDGSNDATQADVPPTPTKTSITPSLSNLSEHSSEQSLDSPSANRTIMPPTSAVRPPTSRQQTCKFTPVLPETALAALQTAKMRSNQSLDGNAQLATTPRPCSASFGKSRAERGFQPPAPLGTSVSLRAVSSPKIPLTKLFSYDTASPVSGRRTPQTPQEIVLPVDGTRLSISQVHGETPFAETSMPPPVTPTTVRDFRSSTSSFVTPVHDRTTNLDVDSSLYARFDKVEQVGKGEFSTVYRVVKNDPAFDAFDVLAASTPHPSTSLSPAKGQVFAVKKSRHPFQGNRDREIKLREARILQALSHAEHVVHYVSDWEHQLHLYIQTEYCEEGHLKKFLYDVGFERRLDDFRIFKILQDLCLVSDSGNERFVTWLI